MTRRRWCVLTALVLAGILLAVLYTARSRLLPLFAHWLDVGEAPRQADCVLVMPGEETTRPFVAAALVKAGLAERVLIPENILSPEVADDIVPPTHEISRRILLRRGVAENRIEILPGTTSNTFADGQALAEFIESSPDARVLVVTNGYHTRRTRWVLRRVLGDRMQRVTMVSAPYDNFQPEQWWRMEEGFLAVVGEYLKMAIYTVRYGRFVYWLLAGVALGLLLLAYRRHRARKAAGPPEDAARAGTSGSRG